MLCSRDVSGAQRSALLLNYGRQDGKQDLPALSHLILPFVPTLLPACVAESLLLLQEAIYADLHVDFSAESCSLCRGP